jgi:hypothetical protein
MICLIQINRYPKLAKNWLKAMDTTFAKKELLGIKSFIVNFYHSSDYFIITERVVIILAVPTSIIAHGNMSIHGLAVEVVSSLEVVHQNAALDLNAIPNPVHARNAKKGLKSSLRALQEDLPNPTGDKVNEELE